MGRARGKKKRTWGAPSIERNLRVAQGEGKLKSGVLSSAETKEVRKLRADRDGKSRRKKEQVRAMNVAPIETQGKKEVENQREEEKVNNFINGAITKAGQRGACASSF